MGKKEYITYIEQIIDEQTRNGREDIYLSKIILETLTGETVYTKNNMDHVYLPKQDLEVIINRYKQRI